MPDKVLCPKCHGQRTTACPACNGSGRRHCDVCGGSGEVDPSPPTAPTHRVAEAMKVISSRQDVRGSLDKIAFELQSSSPEEMATLLKDQLEVWRRTVQEIGIERN